MFNTYLDKLNWRYATKKFDQNKKLSPEQLHSIVEAARLSASSFGLQPWKFVVVSNPEIRTALRAAAWGQPQITDASQLLVFCVKKTMDEAYIKKYIQSIASTRGMSVESLAGMEKMLVDSMSKRTPAEQLQWMKRQVYIALGFTLSACAENDIDACPMEGFDPAQFDQILDLEKEGVESVVLCAIGYRAIDDATAQMKKVRFPTEEVVLLKE